MWPHVHLKFSLFSNPSFFHSPSIQIPYSGRKREKKPKGEMITQWGIGNEFSSEISYSESPYNVTGWESFFTSPDVMRFGKTDLVIHGSLDKCTSVLESSYGCSFRPPVRSSVMAGTQTFRIDRMEVFFVRQANEQHYNEQHYHDYDPN